MLARQTRNNNGQARARETKFCGNAANECDTLLDDLRVDAGSITYEGGKEGSPKLQRINGLQNSG
jgi:hypothetical protein